MIIAIIISIIAAVLLIFTIGMSVGERIKEKTIIRKIRLYYRDFGEDGLDMGNVIIDTFIDD